METEKLSEAINPDRLKTWLNSAFSEVGIHSKDLLMDDKKVQKAAHNAYKKIPLLPFRAAVKATIGKNGFVNLVFKIRDKMLEAETMDLTWLNADYIKSFSKKI